MAEPQHPVHGQTAGEALAILDARGRASERRCDLSVRAGAVVGIPHRPAGTPAGAAVGSAAVLDRAGARARAGIACVVQPLPRAPRYREVAAGRQPYRPQAARGGQALWPLPVDGSGRGGGVAAHAERGAGRGAPLRHRWRPYRRLLLSVSDRYAQCGRSGRRGAGWRGGRPPGAGVPGPDLVAALPAGRRHAGPRALAPPERQRADSGHVPGHPQGEVVGALWHQPVRHRSPGPPPGRHHRLQPVRQAVCGRGAVAGQRLAGLPGAATVLAGGAGAAGVRRAARLLAGAEHAGAPRVAWPVHQPHR
ncbi:conserved hypothetical protein [Ricinus communis]|uniref:Uncharacterized protein n=1 Tax=Ricinus communis TaxID=3988 RepID=B9TNB8_RICCO|nr:conserved hypothetical protein [Ricinus communis]